MSETIYGTTRLWHPRGPQVTLPVTDLTPAGALAQVGAYLDAGWLVEAPGLEEGEEKEQVGWVLRGGFERDGEITPFVLLYSVNEALTWSFLKVYLNKPEDVAAFEHASRMKLDSIPDYVGNDKPQRGASAKTDKFIVKPPRPFGVVFRKNPKHDPSTEEGKMKPARLFVRWADSSAAAPSEPSADTTRLTPRVEKERQVQDLLSGHGKTLAGLMSWLRVPDVHGTQLSGLTEQQLDAALAKLKQKVA